MHIQHLLHFAFVSCLPPSTSPFLLLFYASLPSTTIPTGIIPASYHTLAFSIQLHGIHPILYHFLYLSANRHWFDIDTREGFLQEAKIQHFFQLPILEVFRDKYGFGDALEDDWLTSL